MIRRAMNSSRVRNSCITAAIIAFLAIMAAVVYALIQWNSGIGIQRISDGLSRNGTCLSLPKLARSLDANEERIIARLNDLTPRFNDISGPIEVRWNPDLMIPPWLPDKLNVFRNSQMSTEVDDLINQLNDKPYIPGCAIRSYRQGTSWNRDTHSSTWTDGRIALGGYLIDSLITCGSSDLNAICKELRIVILASPASLRSHRVSLNTTTMMCLALVRRLSDGGDGVVISAEIEKIRVGLLDAFIASYNVQLADWALALRCQPEEILSGLNVDPRRYAEFWMPVNWIYKSQRTGFFQLMAAEFTAVSKCINVNGHTIHDPGLGALGLADTSLGFIFGYGPGERAVVLPWVRLRDIGEYAAFVNEYCLLLQKQIRTIEGGGGLRYTPISGFDAVESEKSVVLQKAGSEGGWKFPVWVKPVGHRTLE